MNTKFLEDITSLIEDKYINETASALYENESRNTISSDDLVILEKKSKKFPFNLVTAAAVGVAAVSFTVGLIIFNNRNFFVTPSEKENNSSVFSEVLGKPIPFSAILSDNKTSAAYTIGSETALNATNTAMWLPYAYANYDAPDWYYTTDEHEKPILKSGKAPFPVAPGAAAGSHIHIGDDSLKNYSLQIKFRFAEGKELRFSIYETTFKGTIHPSFNVQGTETPTWFNLSADGKLFKESTFNYNEFILNLDELDRYTWHTLHISNEDGSLQLIFDGENKGEIYKVTENEYGSFGIGGYNIEIESLSIYDINSFTG